MSTASALKMSSGVMKEMNRHGPFELWHWGSGVIRFANFYPGFLANQANKNMDLEGKDSIGRYVSKQCLNCARFAQGS